MVYGRMFVTAWDCGLDSVENDAVKVLMIAIEVSSSPCSHPPPPGLNQELASVLADFFFTSMAFRSLL